MNMNLKKTAFFLSACLALTLTGCNETIISLEYAEDSYKEDLNLMSQTKSNSGGGYLSGFSAL